MNAEPVARHVIVNGVVQGVGFRPFVYGLAQRHHLVGWVCNTSSGVELVIEGQPTGIDKFLRALIHEPPPLAQIKFVAIAVAEPDHLHSFEIRSSVRQAGAFQPISADVALCADCERELFDSQDRRYLYPFINCTNCGPRFTIIRDLPYDRPATTMADFHLCPACAHEYTDPLNRRFHAQPVACSNCGPRVWLSDSQGRPLSDGSLPSILAARHLLAAGGIVAIKGLGGFHLACDATNPEAVRKLRQRKGRQGKPLAVMAADLSVVEAVCAVSDAERALLTGSAKPIVLLKRRTSGPLAAEVAPDVDTLGVMLPYTPLHPLLLNQTDPVLLTAPAPCWLVMTSGNLSEEPIATDNAEALYRLGPLVDALLLHDRGIATRCDDSVVRVINESEPRKELPHLQYLRRSRGYAPHPVALPFKVPQVVAVGGELKNTVCLARERSAFLSQHIGDLENAETYESLARTVQHLTSLYQLKPELIAHDLHPAYFSTRYALSHLPGTTRIAVQHHHAHIAACLADNGCAIDAQVIGLAFDGTGYGPDGAIWGGEFLIAGYRSFTRAAHFEYLPLPGGDTAIRKPWRTAIGYACALGMEITDLPFYRSLAARDVSIVQRQVARRINSPLTSSLGRLFDMAAVLAGGRSEVSYEAQAAIELEVLARAVNSETVGGHYPFRVEAESAGRVIRLRELLQAVVDDARKGVTAEVIGLKFHRTVAAIAVDICQHIRSDSGLRTVALSGGVWQNELLLHLTCTALRAQDFQVLVHRQTPPNDGGLALGQAVVAAASIVG